MRFSANLGFLWTDRPLTDAIRAAARAGFDAVECHWPYDVPAAQVRATLQEVGLPMVSLNTRRGSAEKGEFGLAALPARQVEARAHIDEAINYAVQAGARMVHVQAGKAQGPDAAATFCDNLTYASAQAAPHGLTVLIEPLNRHDAPGYFLATTDQAACILTELDRPNLRLMFDCYHVQRTEGDVTHRLHSLLPLIGHIQIAAAPDRGPPDHGELCYQHVFESLAGLGWDQPLGAEYRSGPDTDATLSWLRAAQKIRQAV